MRTCSLGLSLVLLSIAGVASAQVDVAPSVVEMGSRPEPAEAWGDVDGIVAVSAWDFSSLDPTVPVAHDKHFRYVTQTLALMFAPLYVPSGVLLTGIEIEGCDTDPTVTLTAEVGYLFNNGASASLVRFPIAAFSGWDFAQGCGLFSADLTSLNHVTDNAEFSYMLSVWTNDDSFGPFDSSLKFASVRVYYRRLVSDPPPAPTFLDVPDDHLFYPFIEALASSGITAGCGGGNFCPGDPVTRGQMAVFLAKALGLHWPN